METKIDILKPFFENPEKEYYIRELSRLLKVNHTTVRQKLNKLVKEGYLELDNVKPFPKYKALISRKFLNLKLYFNLEKLRESGLIENLEKAFEYPDIVLFGSYSYARDNDSSDLDLCVISNLIKDFDTTKYEKKVNRKISLYVFTKKKFDEMKQKNPNMINNICNGIVISGQLEVLK